jgi:choline-sulfatase
MPYRVPKDFQVFDQRPRDPLNPNANWDDRRRYDEGVLYFDHNFGAVIDLLERNRLLDNTAIVFTSDHAEMMGEHGHYGHTMRDTFFDEVIHVPFWIYLPPGYTERFGSTVRANASRNGSNLDIVPTVVDLLGLHDDPLLETVVPELLGRSLLRPITESRTILAENWTAKQNAQPGLVVIHDSWRLVYHPGNTRNPVAAYDVASDPGETRDLLSHIPEPVMRAAQAALAAQPVALHAEFSEKLALASSGSRVDARSGSGSSRRASN